MKPKVALSHDFLLQLSRLPTRVHTKVMKWAILFQTDPKSHSINYESINGARDPNLKSVRMDQDWRGIVFKPEAGDVYVLLYVDHHDEAYRWALNRRMTINPVTGAIQMIMTEPLAVVPETGAVAQAEVAARATPAVAAALPAADGAPAVAAGREVVGRPAMDQVSTMAGVPAMVGIPAPAGAAPAAISYAHLTDHELLSLGVPEAWLDPVRAIECEAGLDALQALLPLEAYEGLFLVAAGDSVTQILSARETRVDRVIDTADFATALETAESQSRFVIVNDDESMLAIMNAPLAQWRVFLHPTQLKLAHGDRSGPVRVLGGAGTGKTVLAMHRAKWLAEQRTPAGKKVLFTTFTRNLAADIEQNLRTLCDTGTLGRIEVRNLDAWVAAFLRGRKLEHRIVYDRKQDAPLQAWQMALAVKDASLDLPDDFYEQELEQVILAQGITTRDQYRLARRIGRGVTLNRARRDAVWPVFEEYRGQLATRKLKEVDDAYREIAELLTLEGQAAAGRGQASGDPGDRANGRRGSASQAAGTGGSLGGPSVDLRGQAGTGQALDAYSAVVVDETQDFGPQALRLLRAMIAPGANDLFFVGDGHQRIYNRHQAAMSRCGIDIRGRSRKLYLNYRTTDEIRRQAVALLEGCEVDDLDEGPDENRRYKSVSHGPAPQMLTVSGLEGAAEAAVSFIRDWQAGEGQAGEGQEVPLTFCVITPSEKTREAMALQLQARGLRTIAITAQSNHAEAKGVIHLATMHRAKGLEFDGVIVVAHQDDLGEPELTLPRRRLLYVALTRAKRGALLALMA